MSIEELERIPQAMADAVRPHLAAATVASYQRFLDAMVCYTRGSGDRLRHAEAHAATSELAAFFGRLAREEAGHYLLAEADLRAFGLEPTGAPWPGVAEFTQSWFERGNPARWLGALYALENVGGPLARDAVTHLSRLSLPREAVRFVMVHLEADAEHGASTAVHVRAQMAAHGDEVLAAAREAADFWVALHQRALAPQL